ncbi:MAG TPA: Riboflavin biosynthesis protein RibD [Hyphomicrobiaceae bacterium MAG_BT-2024]
MALEIDTRFMAMAVQMAERGLGTTAPNPSVGAVVVCPKTRKVLGRGWTQPGRRPHAEPIALKLSGKAAFGATLYVTLEPCSHFGVSPPCVEAIMAAGVQRVVVGIKDPDPRVAGRGLTRLREAGIAVSLGVLSSACRWVTLGHILRVTERRPFIQLKLALNSAGQVPRGKGGKPAWVTGADACKRGHLLRAKADAIVIGQKTLVDDNPLLTCRLPGLAHQSPARFILSGKTPISGTFRIFSDNSTTTSWITRHTSLVPSTILRSKCAIIRVTDVDNQIWLPAVVENFVANGITRLLVEGGPTIWRAFDRFRLVDEVIMFLARSKTDQHQDAIEMLKSFVSRTPFKLIRKTALEHDDIFIFRKAT